MRSQFYWRQLVALVLLVAGNLSIWGMAPVTPIRLIATAFLWAAFCWVFFWPRKTWAPIGSQEGSRSPRS